MRSKSRFMTLVLRENLENDIQNPCAIAVDASRSLSPEATKHLLPSGRYPYADAFSSGWDRTKLARRARPLPKSILLSLRPARARPAVRRRGLLPLGPRPLRLHQDLGAASCCP